MKNIIIGLLVVICGLHALDDIKSNTYLLMDKAVGYYNSPIDDGDRDNGTLVRTVLRNNTLLLIDKDKIASTISYIGVTGTGYNNKYKHQLGDYDVINVENFYYTKHLINNLYLTTGILNFKTGSFNNTDLYDSTNGIGIYGLVDFELEGLLLTWRDRDTIITGGRISKGEFVDTAYVMDTNQYTYDNRKTMKAFNGSYGYTVLIKSDITDKLSMDFNYYTYKEILYDAGTKDLKLVGIEFVYDRLETIGDTFYIIGSMSKTKGDSTLLNKFIETPPSNSYFGKYETHGYSLLLGYSKIFDDVILHRSMRLGFEGKYVSPGYDNMTVGVPLSINNSGALGYTFKMYDTITIKKDFMVKAMFGYYKNTTNKTTQIFGVPKTSPIDEYSATYEDMVAFSIGFIYKF